MAPRRASRGLEATRGADPDGASGIPASPRTFVPRRRLDSQLDLALSRPLTVLVAPAGSGKTVAVARWARARPERVRWLAAQRGARARSLVDALLEAAPADAAGPPRQIRPDDLARRLRAGDSEPPIVVVDDAQHLDADGWALLEAALDQAPDRVHVVLVSRRDPPISTIALELSDGLVQLRADSLRFDDEEARRLVTAHAPDADPEDVAAVLNRARGWAAALVLGARSLAGARDHAAARVALVRTEQPVLDYLLGEVFATLPAATRHLLLCTADESLVTEAAAVALSGDPTAAERLADLAGAGLLVTTYETADGAAWAYHPLLRELLRRQVAGVGPDHALARAAHARAARQYGVLGSAADAVRHASAAGDDPLLVDLLVEHGPALLSSGRTEVVNDALAALPAQAFERWPALLGTRALALRATGDLREAMRVATEHGRAAARLRGLSRQLSGSELVHAADAALLGVWMGRYGWVDIARAVAQARDVLREGGPRSLRPGEPARLAWLLVELSSAEIWLGDLEAATRHADEAVLITRAVGNHELAARGLSCLALLQLLDANVRTAEATTAECLQESEHHGLPDDLADRAHLVLAWSAVFDLRLGEAEAALGEIDPGVARREPVVAALGCVVEAWLVAERGDVVRARQLVAVPPPLPEPVPPYVEALFAVARLRWSLVGGDRSAAGREVEQLAELGWLVASGVFAAELTELDGDREAARRLVEEALRLPVPSLEVPYAVYGASLHARLLLAGGRPMAARSALEDALGRAAPQHLVHPVLAGIDTVAGRSLLAEIARDPLEHPFAADVVDALHREGAPPVRVPAPRPAAAARIPAPLTDREAEVLAELSLGGSYQDVAQALFVTENTVKTHVSALYRKLGVDRRADALRQARDLGLL